MAVMEPGTYIKTLRRRKPREEGNANRTSWADVAARVSGTVTADSEDMEVGAMAAEVATPVALVREDDSSTPRQIKGPSREENKHMDEALQVGEDKREDTGSRDYASPVNEPVADGMINRVGEDAMNKMTMEGRQRTTARTMDMEDIHTVEREETEYDGDTQSRGKERTESKDHRSEDETLPTVKATSPKRPKRLKVESHGEKPQERRRCRARATFSKTQ